MKSSSLLPLRFIGSRTLIAVSLLGGSSSLMAQTYLNFSGLNPTLITSGTGQNVAFAGGSVNVKMIGGAYNNIYLLENNEVQMLATEPGSATFELTFTDLVSGKVILIDDELMRNNESSIFTTNGGGWTSFSAGNGNYANVAGAGTTTVSFQGANPSSPFGNGLGFSSENATTITYTASGTNGLRIGFEATAVPEPAAAVLGFLAAAGFAIRRRRRHS